MVVISKAILVEFGIKHTDVVEPLNRWYEATKKADWKSFPEVKKSFNSVDAVGNDRNVFNIKGNDYRLVAMIFLALEQCLFDSLVNIATTTKLIVKEFDD
jgi:mRNA interferase HigB